MLATERVRRFAEDGFVMSDVRLDMTVVRRAEAESQRIIGDQETLARCAPEPTLTPYGVPGAKRMFVASGAYNWKISNIRVLSDVFWAIATDARIAEEAADLLRAESVFIWKDQLIYKPPCEGSPTGWHQDSHYWRTLSDHNQVTAWIALNDATVRSGCLQMVPGSHRWGNQARVLLHRKDESVPDECDGHPVTVRDICMGVGEIHFHHGMTWHGARGNASVEPLGGFAVHFLGGDTRISPQNGEISVDKWPRVADHADLTRVWPRSGSLSFQTRQ